MLTPLRLLRGSRLLRQQLAIAVPLRGASAGALVAMPHRSYSTEHGEESYDEFNARYSKFFQQVKDLFELQRGLNNCFAHDLVPAAEVLTEALKAARRVNDFATAVRIFEGLKQKCENKNQVEEYFSELKPIREELGISLKEELQ